MSPGDSPTGPSVIIPAYRSQRTISGTLEALGAQTLSAREVIVVDSSPDDETAARVEGFPGVRLIQLPRQTWPHAARNIGVGEALGDPLVFTDPDVYPARDWLARLVAGTADGAVAVGAVACHGDRWLDHGVHFAKYPMWLPGSAPGPGGVHSAALAVPRESWSRVGPFDGRYMVGDAQLGWVAERKGVPVRFVPDAVVDHHHLTSYRGFLRERFARGAEMWRMKAEFEREGPATRLLRAATVVVPVRLVRALWTRARVAKSADSLAAFLHTSPVVVTGLAAWFLGELWATLGLAE